MFIAANGPLYNATFLCFLPFEFPSVGKTAGIQWSLLALRRIIAFAFSQELKLHGLWKLSQLTLLIVAGRFALRFAETARRASLSTSSISGFLEEIDIDQICEAKREFHAWVLVIIGQKENMQVYERKRNSARDNEWPVKAVDQVENPV